MAAIHVLSPVACKNGLTVSGGYQDSNFQNTLSLLGTLDSQEIKHSVKLYTKAPLLDATKIENEKTNPRIPDAGIIIAVGTELAGMNFATYHKDTNGSDNRPKERGVLSIWTQNEGNERIDCVQENTETHIQHRIILMDGAHETALYYLRVGAEGTDLKNKCVIDSNGVITTLGNLYIKKDSATTCWVEASTGKITTSSQIVVGTGHEYKTDTTGWTGLQPHALVFEDYIAGPDTNIRTLVRTKNDNLGTNDATSVIEDIYDKITNVQSTAPLTIAYKKIISSKFILTDDTEKTVDLFIALRAFPFIKNSTHHRLYILTISGEIWEPDYVGKGEVELLSAAVDFQENRLLSRESKDTFYIDYNSGVTQYRDNNKYTIRLDGSKKNLKIFFQIDQNTIGDFGMAVNNTFSFVI